MQTDAPGHAGPGTGAPGEGTVLPRAGRADRVVVHLLLAACALAFLGRGYEAWGWPAVDGYPAIERALDPDFLTGDFYTESTRGYGVDTFQATLLAALQRATGWPYASVLAVLAALRCLTFPWVLFAFVRALTRDRRAALLAVVLGSLAHFALPRTPGWAWLWGDTSPAMFAVWLIVVAWTALLERRAWGAALLFGLTSWIHPLMAVHGGVFAAAILLVDYTAEERRALLRSPADWAAGAVFAASFGLQYWLLSPGPGDRLTDAEYAEIVAWVRHPGDFIPSLFPADTWQSTGAVAVAVAVILWRLGAHFPRRRLFVAGLLVYAAVGALGWWLVEVHPVRVFIQLIPFRLVIVGAPLLLAPIAVWGAREWRAGRWLSLAALGVAYYAASPDGWRIGVPGAVAPGIGVLALVLGRLALERTRWADLEASRVREWMPDFVPPLALAAVAGMVLLHAAAAGAAHRGHAFVIPDVDDQHPVYRWMRESTPPGSVFLVEQHASDPVYHLAVDPQKVRLVGHRPVLASKDFPFLDRDMREWARRWRIALGDGRYDFVEHADVGTFRRIHAELPFDYVVRRSAIEDAAPFLEQVARFDGFAGVDVLRVYRAIPARPAPGEGG